MHNPHRSLTLTLTLTLFLTLILTLTITLAITLTLTLTLRPPTAVCASARRLFLGGHPRRRSLNPRKRPPYVRPFAMSGQPIHYLFITYYIPM